MPQSQDEQPRVKSNKHWLEYAIFLFVVLTAVGTITAAYYTRKQWLTADDSGKRQLRAYVGVVPGGVDNFGDPQKQSFTIIRKNYGATPAYNLFSLPPVVEVIRIGANLTTTFGIQPPDLKDFAAPTLFPSMKLPFNARTANISKQQFDLARVGTEYTLVYYGIIFYTDAFGEKHYTRYCWMFKGESMTAKDADACIGHNDSN